MTPSNKATLDKHYHHWVTLRDAQYLRGLNIHEREDMVRVLREEFWPGYTYDEWCSSCVADMVRTLYTRYDKWLSEQPPPEPEPIIVAATFPVNDKPADVCSATTESFVPPCDVPKSTGVVSDNINDLKKPKNHRRK